MYGLKEKDINTIQSIFEKYSEIDEAILYGSRAKGNYQNGSDIDLTLKGDNLNLSLLSKIQIELEETDLPYLVDLSIFHSIENPNLIEHINRVGICFYTKEKSEEWKEVKLGEILEVKYGKDHKNLEDGSIPCFGSGGFMRGVSTAIYDKDSILIPRKGSLNNIMFQSEPFWTVDTMFWTKIDEKKAVSKFLFYQLTLIDYTNLNVGSAVPSLTVPVINDIDISLPPLPEQKAIADVLSSLDDKIDLLHRQNTTLEQIAETLFRQWFIEEADDSWEEGTLGEICEIIGGYAFKSKDFKSEGNPVIKIKNITNNRVEILDNQFVENCISEKIDEKYRLKNGDIVMAMTGATIGKVGLVCTFDYDFLLLNQRVAVLRSTYQPLLWFLLQAINLEDDILNLSNGAAQANISSNGISSISIPKMSEEKIKEFNSIVEPNFNKILENTKQIRTLEKLRDTLLPKLMSGEVRVKM